MDKLQQTTTHRQSEKGKSPWLFFALTFAFTIPFWVIGGVAGFQLLPGIPIDGLAFICPGLAALVLTFKEEGKSGAKALLRRTFDFNRIKEKVWYAPILLLMPFVMVLSYLLIHLSGTQIPSPQISVIPTLILSILFFIGAIGEELGWSGYVLEPLQSRFGALQASIVIGAVWAVYHYVGLMHVNRSVEWVAWWTLYTLSLRVIMVWLYNNAGKSVFAMVVFHMMINLSWQSFPVNGSYFDPRVTGLILAAVAAIIIFVCGRTQMIYNRHKP